MLPDQTRGVIIEPQQVMGLQERYAEEERLHVAHLAELQWQHEEQREREQLAHLAEVQQLSGEQRDEERERDHLAHLAQL